MVPKELFVLSWKKVIVVSVAGMLSIVLHNLVSAALGTEEALFFIIAVFVIPAYIVISVAYTLISRPKGRGRKGAS